VSAFQAGRTAGQVTRFIVAGAVNTGVTGAIFFGLSLAMAPSLAYTIAFCLGVGFAVAITPRFVFLARVAHTRRALYALWYALVYLVGLGVVYLLHDGLGLDRPVVVVLTLATTATLGFAGARRLFHSDVTAEGLE